MTVLKNGESKFKKRKFPVSESIVVSGMSGRFPLSETIDEFSSNLYSSRDLTTTDYERFPPGRNGFPMASGKVTNLEKFDAEFFNLLDFKANCMDPQLRKLLEVTYEAIIDSGIDSDELKGSKTGFFYGSSFQETDLALGEDPFNIPSYKQIYQTILSYHFDLKGPVYQYDTACGSSFSALSEAFTAMKIGLCDQAIVAGYNISLIPAVTLQFNDLKMISPSGKSKCLDERVDGYGRSEAVCAILLQRESKAKRIYSYIVNTRSNTDGSKEQGINFPSYKLQGQLMKETYEEAGIDPCTVKYVEAHTTGTAVGDPIELHAIRDVFCLNRKDPLLIGCLKSNMGHAEAASGLCSLIKANLIFQNESIPPNILFKKPNSNIEGLIDGSLKPVLEVTPFDKDLISLNCFGFGGSNVHIILKKFAKRLTPASYKIADTIPRLVPVCGRNSESVRYVQNFLDNNKSKITKDFLSLLNIYTKNSLMSERGYTIINSSGHFYHSASKPSKHQKICLFFAGVSNFKPLTYKSMLHIKTFRQTLDQLALKLNEYKIDLFNSLFNVTSFNCFTESIVSMVAIQIALINVFRDLRLEVNRCLGHSIGELACAYFNQVLSENETIIAAYIIGSILDGHDMPKLQLKIKTSWQMIQSLDTSNVELISNQSEECIILGNYQSINKLIFDLESQNIQHEWTFVQKFTNSFIQQNLKRIVATWNSSINGNTLNKESIKAITEYLINSISLSASLMNEIKELPEDVVLIELGSSLIKPIIKSKPIQATYLSCFDSNINFRDDDTFVHFLGHLYINGCNPNLDSIYGNVEYPVPVDTLGLHSIIKWNHMKDFKVYKFPEYFNPYALKDHFRFKINLSTAEDWFLAGHKIDNRTLFPATGTLLIAMSSVCFYHNKSLKSTRMILKDVSFTRAVVLHEEGECTLIIQYHRSNGHFVVTEKNSKIASGTILFADKHPEYEFNELNSFSFDASKFGTNSLSSQDIYKELKIRGYDYGPSFQNLIEADYSGLWGRVTWKTFSIDIGKTGIMDKVFQSSHFTRDFIPFSDSVLQLALLANRYNRLLLVPTGFDYIYFDPIQFLDSVQKWTPAEVNDKNPYPTLPVVYDPKCNVIKTEGFMVKGLRAAIVPRKSQSTMLEKFEFIPFNETEAIDHKTKADLEYYHQMCSMLIKMLKQKEIKEKKVDHQTDVDEAINKALKKFDPQNEQYSLLTNLIRKYNPELISSYSSSSSFAKDILIGEELTLINNERFIRPLIDISLFKNSFRLKSREFSVTEFNQTRQPVCEAVQNAIELTTFGEVKINYHLLCSDPESDTPKNSNVSKLEWDESKTFESFVSNDLVIFKNRSSSENKMSLIKSVSKQIETLNYLLILSKEPINEQFHFDLKAIFANEIKDTYSSGIFADEVIKKVENEGFVLIAQKYIDLKLAPIYGLLFRKKSHVFNPQEHVLIKVDTNNYSEWLDDLKKNIEDSDITKVWLIPKNEETAGLVGLTKCVAFEDHGEKLRCITNWYGSKEKNKKIHNLNLNCELFRMIAEKDITINVYDSHKGWGCYHHITLTDNYHQDDDCKEEVKHCYLNVLTPGQLSSLTWTQAEHDLKTDPQDVLIDIHYAALNFKDIMFATGRLPAELAYDKKRPGSLNDGIIGYEFSGYDQNGNRVMGMASCKALASSIKLEDSDFVWPVPDNWSLEEAASVPVVYATAYYSLIIRGKLQKGESVLIHSGSGGVGLAALSICFEMDCQVYTTVGSQEKRDFLKSLFPKLQDRHFANSRDTSFEFHIAKETNGRGVDVILNSLAEEKLKASLRCLAPGGRFLEIGKYDMIVNNEINLCCLDENRTFESIMLDTMQQFMTTNNLKMKKDKESIRQILGQGIEKGMVKPLPRTVFKKDEIEKAFRHMTTGKHVGKIIVKMKEDNNDCNKTLSLKRVYFDPEKSYLIVGAFGGLGLELAIWLAMKGTKCIIFNSRNGPTNDYHRFSLERLKDAGVEVIISKHDLTKFEDAKQLFESVSQTHPIDGIFNSALVLHDAAISEQTPETFEKVCASKINITQNLDILTRKECPNSKYFVIFSSLVSGRGNLGQSNYGFANSVMENICEKRKQDGFSGLAIQWGLVGDVGFVAEKMRSDVQSIRGAAAQRIYWCFNILEKLLRTPLTVVSSCVRLENVKSFYPTEKGNLLQFISHVLGIKDIYKVDPQLTLSELGMDSLMAIEIKQVLERDYHVSLTQKEIRQYKIQDLIKLCKDIESEVQPQVLKRGFLSLIDHKVEKNATTPLNNITTGKPIYFLPSFDGNYDNLILVASKIKRPAIGLNWNIEMRPLESWTDIAFHYGSKVIPKEDNENLDLVGYSFGGLIAMELASYLDQNNESRKVKKMALIDSYPEVLKADNASAFNEKGEVNEVEMLISAMNKNLKGVNSTECIQKIYNCPKQERYNRALQLMKEKGLEEAKANKVIESVEATAKKLKLLYDFTSKTNLTCEVIHVRAKSDSDLLKTKPQKIGEEILYEESRDDLISRNVDQISEMIEYHFKA